MKKILTTACVLGTLISTANAIEMKPYVGLDTGYTTIKADGEGAERFNRGSAGLNIGTKFDLNEKYFVSGEVYGRYGDFVNHNESDWSLRNNYGAKLYTGYNFTDDFNGFVSYGLNYMRDANEGVVKNKFASSFGFGAGYLMSENIEARLSYDYYLYSINGVDLDINNIRLGVNYMF